jgi:transaldolase
MGLFLDSAKVPEAKRAFALGYVSGVTTNPSLLAQVTAKPEEVIHELCEISPGPVFYQLSGATVEEREREGIEFAAIDPKKVVLKIPCTAENMSLATRLCRDRFRCAATAVYSAHQALVACEAGCGYVIPYVNRATQLLGDGCALVTEMAQVIGLLDKPVRIVAASIKSSSEAVRAVLAGADDLTLPLDGLLGLANHPLTDEAIAEFNRASARR